MKGYELITCRNFLNKEELETFIYQLTALESFSYQIVYDKDDVKVIHILPM